MTDLEALNFISKFLVHASHVFIRFCSAFHEGANRTMSSAYKIILQHKDPTKQPIPESMAALLTSRMCILKSVGVGVLEGGLSRLNYSP